ncbi:MAG TPA: hypothetical protein VMV74_03525 [Bacteroidales bacterium]|nr:hypothetical protein [Bacteroidales bacterium]
MRILAKLFFTFSFLLIANFTRCQVPEYQKIQLKDFFASADEKANNAVWRTDYYICTGIAYAKSIGKTPSDFAVFVGNHHSWEGIKGQGLEPAVQILNAVIKLYENSTFEITSESDSLVTMLSNRPYKVYFENDQMLGVSVGEFESCLWGHIKILAERIGLNFNYKIEGNQIVSSLAIKK